MKRYLCVLALVFLPACHWAEAVKEAKEKDSLGEAVSLVPAAIAGDIMAWAKIAGIVVGFLTTAVAGHEVGKKRERKKRTKTATFAASVLKAEEAPK